MKKNDEMENIDKEKKCIKVENGITNWHIYPLCGIQIKSKNDEQLKFIFDKTLILNHNQLLCLSKAQGEQLIKLYSNPNR